MERKSIRTRLHLHLHCSNLPRVGLIKSPPDTSAILTFVDDPDKWQTQQDVNDEDFESHSSEIIEKQSHPQWTHFFHVDYEYGTEKFFCVRVMRHQSDGSHNAYFGGALFEVSDILASKGNTKAKRLRNGGAIFAHLQPVSTKINAKDPDKIFRFQLFARENLDLRKTMSTIFDQGPNTLIELAKRQVSPSGHSWITVHRSRPVLGNFQPTWDTAEIDLEACCNGDLRRPMRISIWIYKKGSHDVALASCETTVQKLLDAQIDEEMEELEFDQDEKSLVMRTPLQKKGSSKEVGRIGVRMSEIVSTSELNTERLANTHAIARISQPTSQHSINSENDPFVHGIIPIPNPASSPPGLPPNFVSPVRSVADGPSFQDYMNNSSCEIDFSVAIDFTSSNGDPRIPGTNHYRSGDSMNDYEESIMALGNVMSTFSSSTDFSVWGFGAKFGGTVRHIFQCGPSTTVTGVDGILDAYHNVFCNDLVMSGPTVLSQVIHAAAMKARQFHNLKSKIRYCVLLILTDGTMHDLNETIRKLGVYRNFPLHVIVVGIGRQEDFKAMYALNQSPNSVFMEFCNHQNDPRSLSTAAVQGLSIQLVEYMTKNGIYPNGHVGT